MTEVKKVYYMAPSVEVNRPLIKETGYFDEWEELEQPFPFGIDCILCHELASFEVRADDALDWDWYGQNGPWGMWSQRAKDLLWPYANGCLRCFQTSLNGAPYYILRVAKELAIDCLDRDRSELKYFPKNPNDIMDIKRYAFYRERLHDPMIFHVPERPEILGTQSIKQIVEEAGLKGFRFEDVEHPHR